QGSRGLMDSEKRQSDEAQTRYYRWRARGMEQPDLRLTDQSNPHQRRRLVHHGNLTVSTAGKSAQERSEWDDRFMRRVWLRLSSSSRAGADRVFGYCDR